jgi:hypothetical protein
MLENSFKLKSDKALNGKDAIALVNKRMQEN